MITLALLLLQAPAPTVGDTIWIERRVALPGGAELRPAPWDLPPALGLLGRPVVRRDGAEVIVAYPLVAWTAGTHHLLVPGPILIRADGRSDTLAAEPRTLQVASVLPTGTEPERLAPQPEAGVVAERIRSPLPLLVMLALAAALFVPAAWWWRRRGPPVPAPGPAPSPAEVPLDEWSEAGEHRAVAAVVARGLRSSLIAGLPGSVRGVVTSRLLRVITEQRPQWPVEEIGLVLRALESAEFAEQPVADIAGLTERAGRLRERLERES